MTAPAPDRPCAGRVALVTGASRGIGAAVAERLAAAGAAVAVTARTLEDEPGARLAGSLRGTVAAVEAHGVPGFAVAADLTDPEDRARIVPAVEEALGPVDILVNNAAAAIYMPVASMPYRRWRVSFEVNLHAPVDLTQAVLPGMRSRRRGWIVNVSSVASRHPVAFLEGESALGTVSTAYGASKAALERFTTGLAAEVAGDGVVVNAVAPVAAVRTPGAEVIISDLLDNHPELVEPMDYLLDAILHLVTCSVEETTGQVVTSQGLLQELGRLEPAVEA